jgi:hypothetical protein
VSDHGFSGFLNRRAWLALDIPLFSALLVSIFSDWVRHRPAACQTPCAKIQGQSVAARGESAQVEVMVLGA